MINTIKKWQQPWRNSTPINIITGEKYPNLTQFSSDYYWIFEDDLKRYRCKPVPYAFYTIKDNKKLYNASSCDGINKLVKKDKKFKRCETIVQNYIKKHNIKISHSCIDSEYNVITDTVNIFPPDRFYTTEQYYGTLFHELIHSTGIPRRLGRYKTLNSYLNQSKNKKWMEEIIAETGAYLLCQCSGILKRTKDYHMSYIYAIVKCSKLNIEILNILFNISLKEAEQAVKYIMYK